MQSRNPAALAALKYIACLCAGALLFGACQAISGADLFTIDQAHDAGAAAARSDGGRTSADNHAADSGMPHRADKPTATTSSAHAGAPAPAAREDAAVSCKLTQGAECDPVQQCGCRSGAHCQLLGARGTPTCAPVGTLAPGAACTHASDCPMGQTCDRRVCRSYCRGSCDNGKCLPALTADGTDLPDVGVCWRTCDPSKPNTCAMGTSCLASSLANATGSYCAAPAETCPTVRNGKCDEPDLCAKGTDAEDCGCNSSRNGAVCDLVQQCGCKSGLHCRAADSDGTPLCVEAGVFSPGSVCASGADCSEGHDCALGVCRPYCAQGSDCKSGSCVQVPGRGSVKVCMTSCDLASGKPCLPTTTCRDLGSPAGPACVR